MYTLRKLYNDLDIPLTELSRQSGISDVTLAKIRDGASARRSTINSLLRTFSKIYGVKLSTENVKDIIIKDKLAKREAAEKSHPVVYEQVPGSSISTMPRDAMPQKERPQNRSTIAKKSEKKDALPIPDDLPEGTIKLVDFAEKYGIPGSSMSRYVNQNLGIKKGEWIPTTMRKKPSGTGSQHFLTPEQQEKALEILNRHGKIK